MQVRIVLLAALVPVLRAQVVISQIYGGGGNTGAALRNDFVELFNRGASAVSVAGWSVQITSATGLVWQVTPLSGTIAPGRYYLVQQAAGAGGSVALPAPEATGTVAMGATAGKVALVRSTAALQGTMPASADIVDLVGYGAADFARGNPTRAPSNTTAVLRLRGGCVDTQDNFNDFQTGAPSPRNGASPANDCNAPPPQADRMAISAIQGPGAESPLVGKLVETRGYVTERRRNGFYIESIEPDDDPLTSEGLFVFTQTAPPAGAQSSAIVRVTGTVAEFRSTPDAGPVTELVNPVVVVEEPPALRLRSLVLVDSSKILAGDLERYEGMYLIFPLMRIVSGTGQNIDERNATATSNGIFFVTPPDAPRPLRTVSGNLAALRVQAGVLEGSGAGPIDCCDLVGISGVVEDGRGYGVLTRNILGFFTPRTEPAPVSSPGDFTFASMNLRRFFDTVDDPNSGDIVVTQDAFDRRVAQVAAAISGPLQSPDVIAVEECESLAGLSAIAMRVGGYRAFLEEGNDPGGIDVGFLVKTSRVTVESVTQEGKTATYTTPAGGTATLHDRPPLVLQATIGGFRFRAIAVHMRSLLNADTPEVQAKRRAQAQAVGEFARRHQAANPSDGLIVLGDFNSFAFDAGLVDVVGIIQRTVTPALENLSPSLSLEEGYTFIEQGVAQTLDHALVNPALRQRWSRYRVAHLNAGFAEPAYSDHDPLLASFFLDPAASRISAAGIVNAAGYRTGPVAPGEIVGIFGRDIAPGTPVTIAGAPVQANSYPGFALAVVPAGLSGEAAIRVGDSNEVRVPVADAAPAIFAATRNGEFIDLYVNGVDPAETSVWIGIHRAETVTTADYFIRVAAPPNAAGPVWIVYRNRTSDPAPLQ
ncbi:MAG: lamin tail domain-containing protein [Bryobacteraceae bacterium]